MLVVFHPQGDLDPYGIDLAQKTMFYEPSRRITAKAALHHPYFADLDKTGLQFEGY